LDYQSLAHKAQTDDIVAFLPDVHARWFRPIIVVCDRLSAHRAAVRRLHEEGATWLDVEWLPPYAPDLDPVEDVWIQSKWVDLINIVPEDIDQLCPPRDHVLDTYRDEPQRLRSFFAAAGRRDASVISPVKLTAVDTGRSGTRNPSRRFVVVVVAKKPTSRPIG